MRDQDKQVFRDVLAAGLTWLYDTAQPDGAIIQHQGLTHAAGSRLKLSFVPMPDPVIVIDIVDAQYGTDVEKTLRNPLTADECTEVEQLLAELGRPPFHRWNGAGCETGSFRLADPIHPTLEAARKKYHDGCPDHTGPLCSWDGCPWYPTGNDLIVKPAWPAVVADAA